MALLAGGAGGLMVAVAPPASAQTTLYVSSTGTVTADGTTCADPGYATIQSAVEAATSGDTITVCAGSYTGAVTVAVPDLTINGAQASFDAATDDAPTSSQSVLGANGTGEGGFDVAASGVTIDGFTITGSEEYTTSADTTPNGSPTTGFGIYLSGGAPLTGPVIEDDIIEGNGGGMGFGAQAGSGLTVEQNLFQDNASAADSGEIFDVFPTTGAVISGNTMITPLADAGSSSAVNLSGGDSDVTISGNTTDGATAFILVGLSDSSVTDNDIEGTGPSAEGADAIGLYGDNSDVSITGNQIDSAGGAAVDVASYIPLAGASVPTANSDVTIQYNSIDSSNATGVAVAAPYDEVDSYTADGTINATDNWWGCAAGPVTGTSSATCGSVDNGQSGVTVTDTPYLKDLALTPTGASYTAGTTATVTATLQDSTGATATPPAGALGISFTAPGATTKPSQGEGPLSTTGTATYAFTDTSPATLAVTGQIEFAYPIAVTPEISGAATASFVAVTSPTSAAPTVTMVSPTSGPQAGGTPVTITGTGFASGATVKFGTVAAVGVTVVSATEITATSPAGTGTANVTVTTTAGTSAVTTADQFTYTSTTVTPVAPKITVTSRTGRGDVVVSGTATPGATVELSSKAYGQSTDIDAASAVANATTGAFSFTEYIRRTTTFEANSSGLSSNVVTADVTVRVYEFLTSGTKKVTVRVETNPTVSGVDVSFERVNANGSLTRLKRQKITSSSGVLTSTLRIARTSITIEAVVASGDGAVGGTSPKHTVRVKQ